MWWHVPVAPPAWEAEARGLLDPRSSGLYCSDRSGVCTKFGIWTPPRSRRPLGCLRRGELAQVGNGTGQNSHADQ